MRKKALITGITGQDGAYLAELLLQKGYKVFGLVRIEATKPVDLERLQSLRIAEDVGLVQGDLLDVTSLMHLLELVEPDEVYNLAAQSLVPGSWTHPLRTGAVTGMGVANILEAIRLCRSSARFYQASSSEMFGGARQTVRSEDTPFCPRSPYAVAKLYGHWSTVNYREGYGLHTSSGIMFNHESPLRGAEFVSRKITSQVARIRLGLADRLTLGNLDAMRDWGDARDFVRAMWLMLQQPSPGDYVVATGRAVSVRHLCQTAFRCVGLHMEDHVVVDPGLVRPAEVSVLRGDASKARRCLGWQPTIVLEDMIQEMVEADLRRWADKGADAALAA